MPDIKVLERVSEILNIDFISLLIFFLLFLTLIRLCWKLFVKEFDKKADSKIYDKKFANYKAVLEKIETVCNDRFSDISEKVSRSEKDFSEKVTRVDLDLTEVKTLSKSDREKLITVEKKILEHEAQTNIKIESIESKLAIMQPLLQDMSEKLNQIIGHLDSFKR